MLQDAWSCLKMLVFDRLGLPLYSGILQFGPQIQPFHLIPCILSLDLMLASTLDEYSRLLCFPFPPSFLFLVVATRWWIPGARCHRWRILLLEDRRRPGVVRRSQAGGLASSIVVAFAFAFLRRPCLTYVFTQILLVPLTIVYRACIRALEAPGL